VEQDKRVPTALRKPCSTGAAGYPWSLNKREAVMCSRCMLPPCIPKHCFHGYWIPYGRTSRMTQSLPDGVFQGAPVCRVREKNGPVGRARLGKSWARPSQLYFFGYPQSRNLTGENFRPGPSSMLLRPSESLVGFEANRSAGLRTPLSGRSSRTEEASTWSGVVPVDSARRNGLRTWVYFRGDAAFGARPLTWLAFPPRSDFVSIFGG
jgi:hypothetical protein